MSSHFEISDVNNRHSPDPVGIESNDDNNDNNKDEVGGGELSACDFHTFTWKFLGEYFRQPGTIVKHQLDSFNDFILCKIDQIIEGFNDIEVQYDFIPAFDCFRYKLVITIDNPVMSKQSITEKDGSVKTMTPNDARLRNLTYASTLSVDVNVRGLTFDDETRKYTEDSKKLRGVSLGKIPIMVRSQYCTLSQGAALAPSIEKDECRNDQGGYFVVNGTEKVVISQDRIAENKTYVFLVNKTSVYSHVAEIRSVAENRFGVPKTTSLKMTSKPTQFGRQIRANILHIRTDVPVFVLFRALGVESDLDIVRMIVGDVDSKVGKLLVQELVGSTDEASFARCTRDALEYLSRNLHAHGQPRELAQKPPFRISIVRSVLSREFLPHVGPDLRHKALYLGYMVHKLLRCYLGLWDLDDRDSYINKRIDTPGVCLANLFRQYYGKVVKDMKSSLQKDIRSGSWRASGRLIMVINKTNVGKVIKSTVIESGLKYGLATGNWGMKSTRMRQGVAQVLNRMTDMATLSHLRRVNTPIEKTGKLVLPRKLHSTQWGVICPSETPEGASIGLVKNLAITSTVTVAAPSDLLRSELVQSLGVIPHIIYPAYSPPSSGSVGAGAVAGAGVGAGPGPSTTVCPNFDYSLLSNSTRIFVNGDLMGVHREPARLHKELRRMKRCGAIHPHTSIAWYVMRGEMCISTEGGRCVRPLYVIDVDRGYRLRLDRRVADAFRMEEECGSVSSYRNAWSDLVLGTNFAQQLGEDADNSVVEYLDIEEVNCAMIAMHYEDVVGGMERLKREQATTGVMSIPYSHLEMDPSVQLGAMAGCIPFPDHNQSPRNTYQAAMGKQAVGLYATNFRHRYDTMAFVLNYPQQPLVSTRIAGLINPHHALSGINAVVAIMTYTGFNQEDAVILNQSAVERGMFGATFYRTFREQNNKNHSSGEEEFFCRPDAYVGGSDRGRKGGLKLNNYSKLGDDGFVPENTYVQSGDVLVGKCMPQKVGTTVHHKDTSLVLKNNERGFVDRNASHNRYFINVNGDGYSFCKVRVRTERTPTIGDKFSSRHGQKGTMGMILPQHEMPFTADGLVPDIIINPNAIPSRMTNGQLMECIMGKACCGVGAFGDATPFTSVTEGDIAKQLVSCGMEEHGDEVMYNSRTGEQITTSVFIGPTYYQRLKHMVDDKLHSRSNNGPVVMLTRQPAEGRARDGGLRLGEMEIECNWAHGIMHFLKERFMECSDNYRVFVCKKCGMMATAVNPERNIYSCKPCQNTTHFAEIRIPYACKLLFQEVQAMGIGTKLLT